MKKKYKIIYLIIILIIILLAWSPWLNNKSLHDKILMTKAKIDGTMGNDGTILCDYNIIWVPFGRWIASCEGGYFVTFYGDII